MYVQERIAKFTFFLKKFLKYLHIPKNLCTFAPAFDKRIGI